MGEHARQLLNAVRDGRLTAFTSLALLDELAEVLGRDHLAALIARLNTTAADRVYGYAKLARLTTRFSRAAGGAG